MGACDRDHGDWLQLAISKEGCYELG